MGEAQPRGTWGLGGSSEMVCPAPRPETTSPSPAAGERLGQMLSFCFPASNLLRSSGGTPPAQLCEALRWEAEAWVDGGRRAHSFRPVFPVLGTVSSLSPSPGVEQGEDSPLLPSAGVPCAVLSRPTELASWLGLPLRVPSLRHPHPKPLNFNNSSFSPLPKP